MCDSGDLNLTPDEVTKLKKAFKDPEFQKLFREYAEEISDPANKKKYEDEIRMMELEQGMDVVFVNPTPGHCLKTRHWPGVSQCPESGINSSAKDESTQESVKVFINVCKSDKVGCPEMKPMKNDSSRQGENGVYWSLPHCFTPPREDIDKAKKHAMVYDVAFNPKAFELAKSSTAFRRLLDTTAVEGVQKQYNLYFGKTFSQAQQFFSCRKDRESNHSRNGPSTDSVSEDYLIKAVHLLKGVSYKGVSTPTVIRRRRSDYEQRQAEIKKREAEDLKLCSSAEQKQAIKMLSSFRNCSNPEGLSNGTRKNEETVKLDEISTPTKPDYSITYSSDFDLSNCRYSSDMNPLCPPDRLKINVKLPGLSSSSCVDLEVTEMHIHLSSRKPIAYLLDLKLPYKVNDAEGTAKFDKSTHTLCITLPIVKNVESTTCKPTDSTINGDEKDVENETKSVEYSSTTNTSDHESVTLSAATRKRARRKRRKQRTRSNIVTESSVDTSSDGGSSVSKCPNFDLPVSDVVAVDKSVTQTEKEPEQLTNTDEKLSEVEKNIENDNKITASQPLSTAVSLSTSPGVEIKVNQVSSCEMILSKDRRLAPVRFRQDPFSLTVLLDVRGILPKSLVINWTDPLHFKLSDNTDMPDSSSSQLLLLITFSSCGSGGFTMDWGIVLQCPSSAPDKYEYTLNGITDSFNSCRSSESSLPPQIISCHISLTNGVLVIRKPSCNCDDLSMNKKLFSEMLSSRAVWWTSVATGRTLTAGMEECSFIGMESFTPHCRQNSFLSTDVNETSVNCYHDGVFSSTQLTNNVSSINSQLLHKCCTSNQQCLKSVNVTSLSDKCCSIEWDPTVEFIGSNIDFNCNLMKINDSCFMSNHQSNLINQHSNKLHVTNENDNNNYSVRRLRYNSTPGNPGLVLKSILKQRSISESSGDEMTILEGNILRDAGLASNREHPLTSDEFPTASSDENHDSVLSKSDFRRCISSDKLSGTMSQCHPHLPIFRQRVRSVSFCQRDQHVDFSPRDTVETLHHALCNLRKNLRKRNARRHRASGGNSKQSDNVKSIPKMSVDINTPVLNTHISSNDSLSSSTEVDHCGKNFNCLVSEQDNPNSTESTSTIRDSFTLHESKPNIPVHSRSDSHLENLPILDSEPNHSQSSCPEVISKCYEKTSEIVPKHPETTDANGITNSNFSAVHLTASPILELDEE
uniref:Protein kintoun n=1 Tax=Schistosoma mansoni TaxID=6183 RepID=A0A3Q0KI17_SCHMA